MSDAPNLYTNDSPSLFDFMLRLRSEPIKVLQPLFPHLDLGSAEPRNLSREHKGTPDELTGFMVVLGFGDPLKHVIAVALHMDLDVSAEPAWADDHSTIERVYGMTPIVLALASEQAAEAIFEASAAQKE